MILGICGLCVITELVSVFPASTVLFLTFDTDFVPIIMFLKIHKGIFFSYIRK